MEMLERRGIDPKSIDVFVGRGGSAQTQHSGVTVIDEKLYNDTRDAVGGSEHPAKLGVMIAWDFARRFGKSAFTLNPTNVDEYSDLARLTGIRGIYRKGHSHVLNQKAVAEFHAEKKLGRRYEDCNFIVAHIDGGITVGAHERGRMVDGNMGADGEGAFTPTRIGSLPVPDLLDYVEKHSIDAVRKMCSRAGGFVDLLGTSNADTVHKLVEQGDRMLLIDKHAAHERIIFEKLRENLKKKSVDSQFMMLPVDVMLMSDEVGLIDTTCAPEGMYAAFNNARMKHKRIILYPYRRHSMKENDQYFSAWDAEIGAARREYMNEYLK